MGPKKERGQNSGTCNVDITGPVKRNHQVLAGPLTVSCTQSFRRAYHANFNILLRDLLQAQGAEGGRWEPYGAEAQPKVCNLAAPRTPKP